MQILDVRNAEFREYGRIIENLDTTELLIEMDRIPFKNGVAYEASIPALESCKVYEKLHNHIYGGMPIQLGMCWGHNTKLNCLEYHRDSEINIGTEDFILLLAKESEIENGKLDTSKVKAFKVPKGLAVEIFGSTLHYAPCNGSRDKGFKVAIVLPRGTNTTKPDITVECYEDSLMTARNKWLLAHPESDEAKAGAVAALTGINIDIAESL